MKSLPKKRMGAGCLFFDEQGRVLLVRPTYKPVWEIPGGIVELNESPLQCCRREVQEEIGLARSIGDLLVVDYNRPAGAKNRIADVYFFRRRAVAGRNRLHPAAFRRIERIPVFCPRCAAAGDDPHLARAGLGRLAPDVRRGRRLPGRPAPLRHNGLHTLQVKLPGFADQVVAEFKVGFAFYQAEPGLLVNVARRAQIAVGP